MKNQCIEKLEKHVETQNQLLEGASKILKSEFGFKSKSHIVDYALIAADKHKKLQEKFDSITFKDIIKYANNKKERNHEQKLSNSKITKTYGKGWRGVNQSIFFWWRYG